MGTAGCVVAVNIGSKVCHVSMCAEMCAVSCGTYGSTHLLKARPNNHVLQQLICASSIDAWRECNTHALQHLETVWHAPTLQLAVPQ